MGNPGSSTWRPHVRRDWTTLVVGACVGGGVVCVVAVGLAVAMRRGAEPDRFKVEHVRRGEFEQLVRIDRQTGKTEIFNSSRGWEEPHQAPPMEAASLPEQPRTSELDGQELAALTASVELGDAYRHPGPPLLVMNLYNGGRRRIVMVVARVYATNQAGAVVFDRDYRFELYEDPADPLGRMARHHGDIPGCEPLAGAIFAADAGFPRGINYRFGREIKSAAGIAP